MSNVTIDEVQRMAQQLTHDEQLRLIEELARGIRQPRVAGSKPDPLAATAAGDADALSKASLALAARVLAPEDFSDWKR